MNYSLCFLLKQQLFAFLIMLGAAYTSTSQTIEEEAGKGLNSLYHFRFAEADSIISDLEQNFPDHYLSSVVRANYFWWKMISQQQNDEVESNYLQSLMQVEDQLTHAAIHDNASYDDLFYAIHLYAFRARLDLMNGDYFKALRHLNQSIGYISKTLGKEQQHQAFMLTSGLYNYLAGYGRREYPLLGLYTLMYPEGNMEKGLFQLKQAADGEELLVNTEANYFLMKIFFELENKPLQALEYAAILVDQYPDNLIFMYYYHRIAAGLELQAETEKSRSDYFKALKNNKQLSRSQLLYFEDLL